MAIIRITPGENSLPRAEILEGLGTTFSPLLFRDQNNKRMLFTWNDDEVPFAVSSGRSQERQSRVHVEIKPTMQVQFGLGKGLVGCVLQVLLW